MTQFVQGMPLLGPNPWDLDFTTPTPQPDPGLRGSYADPLSELGLRGSQPLGNPVPAPKSQPKPAPEPVVGSGKWLGGLILDALGVQKQSLPETTPKDPQGGTIVTRALEDFVFTPAYVGLNEAAKDFTQTAFSIWKDLKQYDETYGPREVPELAQPTTMAELMANPRLAGQKMMTSAFRFAPAAAGAVGGALAVGPAAGAGAGTLGVAELLGLTGGASMATLGQVWGVNLDTAQKKYPGDPEKAYDEAVRATAVDTGFAAFSTLALGANPFGHALKDMALQTIVTQPGIGVVASKAHQAETGDNAGLTLADEYLNVTGPSVLMAGAGAVVPKMHGILTPEAAAEPWSLPWKKNGEAFEIDPEVAAAIPDDQPAPGEPHPAEAFGSALQRVKNPVDAWHGSARDFDRFDSRFMGQGEGAQAYGEGLYFGEERAVGEQYRDDAAAARNQENPAYRRAQEWIDQFATKKQARQEIDASIKQFRDRGDEALAQEYEAMREQMDKPNKGKLYNVDLHVKPDQTLNWDLPISQQPEIAKKLAAAGIDTMSKNEWSGVQRPSPPGPVHWTNNGTFIRETPRGYEYGKGSPWDAEALGVAPTLEEAKRSAPVEPRSLTGGELMHRLKMETEGFGPAYGKGTSDALRKAGIRALKYLDRDSRDRSSGKQTSNYVMLHDEDIAIKAKFQKGHNGPPADDFYYKTERLLPTIAERAPAAQFEATLRNKGVKAEELDDLGIAKFLKEAAAKNETVTREQIQTLIEANRAEFQVKTYGDDPSLARRAEAIFDEGEKLVGKQDPASVRRREELAREEAALDKERFEGDAAKYDTFVMPGGENYREIVLQLRPRPGDAAPYVVDYENGARMYYETEDEASAAARSSRDRGVKVRRVGKMPVFSTSHWDTADNPIAHLRVKDRTATDGVDSIHMEEGQSDWHNEGKREGYDNVSAGDLERADQAVADATPRFRDLEKEFNHRRYLLDEFNLGVMKRAKEMWRIYDRNDLSKVIFEAPPNMEPKDVMAKARELGAGPSQIERSRVIDPQEQRHLTELRQDLSEFAAGPYQEARDAYMSAVSRREVLQKRHDKGGVADAPFKKSISELMFKKLVRHAIDNGYDRVTWNTGEQVAESQGLNRVIERLDYASHDGKTWEISAVDVHGHTLPDLVGKRFSSEDLDRYLGKDVAERIRKSEGKRDDIDMTHRIQGSLEGDDLKISPAGKRTTYDKVFVNAAKAFEKMGGKYGKVKVPVSESKTAKTAEVHALDITPEMKAKVLGEGLPYYQRGESDGPYRERKIGKVSLTPEQLKTHGRLLREITDTIKTMAPHVKVLPVQNLVERGGGWKAKHTGAFFPETAVGPLIVFALDGPNGFNTKVAGTARHEVVHALRRAGIINGKEWQILVDAATAGGWKAKHRIDDRYSEFEEDGRMEEAIAEEMGAGFGDGYALHSPLVRKVFQKLNTLMRRIKTSVQKVMGKDVRAQEIMEMIESGAMGWRRPEAEGGEMRFQAWDPDTLKAKYAAMGRDELLEEMTSRSPALAARHKSSSMVKMRQALFDDDVSTERTKNELAEVARIAKKYGGEPAFQRSPHIDTPEFKRWFGKSKIVDENKQPLTVYHGTTAREDFSEFNMGRPDYDPDAAEARIDSGDVNAFLGTHFAKEPSVASKFAEGLYGSRYGDKGNGGRVYPVNLKIEKPFRVDEIDMNNSIWSIPLAGNDFVEAILMQEIGDRYPLLPDKRRAEELFGSVENAMWAVYDDDAEFRANVNRRADRLESQGDDPTNEVKQALADEYRADLEEQGYDGIVYTNRVEGGTSYIVFQPEQVKSVFNRGTFDESDPNIMFQKAEPTDSPKFKNWFKQSKAVDGRGKPKLLWHGTESLFREFKADPHTATIDGEQRQFTTFYFTDKKSVAASYADQMDLALGGENGLMPVYLSLQNPLVLDWEGANWWNKSPMLEIVQAVADGHDGVIVKNMRDEADGGGAKSTVYIVFDPKQIKSAHNEGTWRTDTADIYLQAAPAAAAASPASARTLPAHGAGVRDIDDENAGEGGPGAFGPGDKSDDALYDGRAQANDDWRRAQGLKLAGQASRERGIGPREGYESEMMAREPVPVGAEPADGAITMDDLLSISGTVTPHIAPAKVSKREVSDALQAAGRRGADLSKLDPHMREIELRRRQLDYGARGIGRRADEGKRSAERQYKRDTKDLKEPPPFDTWVLDQIFPRAY